MAQEKCSACGRRSIYVRRKTKEVICRLCGHAGAWEGGEALGDGNPTRDRILDTLIAQQKAVPGIGEIRFKALRAACRYAGPVEAEIGKLQSEGFVRRWNPYGSVEYDAEKVRQFAKARGETLPPAPWEEEDDHEQGHTEGLGGDATEEPEAGSAGEACSDGDGTDGENGQG